jgi:hypothetical protein
VLRQVHAVYVGKGGGGLTSHEEQIGGVALDEVGIVWRIEPWSVRLPARPCR